MAKGISVITINKLGGASLLDEDTRWLCDGSDKESYIENIKNAIIMCILHPDEVERCGRNAQELQRNITGIGYS